MNYRRKNGAHYRNSCPWLVLWHNSTVKGHRRLQDPSVSEPLQERPYKRDTWIKRSKILHYPNGAKWGWIGQRLCTGSKRSMSCTSDSILNEGGAPQHWAQAVYSIMAWLTHLFLPVPPSILSLSHWLISNLSLTLIWPRGWISLTWLSTWGK